MRAALEPPDGGWGWVVAGASSLIYFLIYGLLVSNGILMVALMNVFNKGRTEMAWIPILCFALSRITAPASAIIANRLSHRLVVFTGGLLVTLGYALGFLAKTYVQVFLTLGVTVGIGSGFVIFPASILTSLYFSKHISLANGVYTAGASMGCILGPLLTEHLVQTTGLRFTFLILGGIALHICVAASLFQPVAWHAKRVTCDLSNGKTDVGKTITTKKNTVLNSNGEVPIIMKAHSGDIEQQLKKSSVVLTRLETNRSSLKSIRSRNRVGRLDELKIGKGYHSPKPAWRSSESISTPTNDCYGLNFPSRQTSVVSAQEFSTIPSSPDGLVVDAKNDSQERNLSQDLSVPMGDQSDGLERRRSSRLSQILRHASIAAVDPMNRLPFQSARSNSTVQEEEQNQTETMSIQNDLSSEPDLSFFKMPIFYLMCFTASAFYMVLNLIGVMIPDFAQDELIEKVSLNQAALLLSIASAVDFVTRFSLSWAWDLPCINRTYCHLFACALSGASFVSFLWVDTYAKAIASCVTVGIASGISGVLVTVLFLQKVGTRGFGLALSFSSMLGGIIMVGSGSFIGLIKDMTGSYKLSFLIVGIFAIFTALTWLMAELCCLKQNSKTDEKSSGK